MIINLNNASSGIRIIFVYKIAPSKLIFDDAMGFNLVLVSNSAYKAAISSQIRAGIKFCLLAKIKTGTFLPKSELHLVYIS